MIEFVFFFSFSCDFFFAEADGAEVESAPVIRGEEIGETQRQPNVSMT